MHNFARLLKADRGDFSWELDFELPLLLSENLCNDSVLLLIVDTHCFVLLFYFGEIIIGRLSTIPVNNDVIGHHVRHTMQ
jgi:hypothetical protein